MRIVKFTEAADMDLFVAAEWHEDARTGYGHLFFAELEEITAELRSGHREYSIRFDDIRRVNMKRFSYALFYFLHRDEVVILAVLHTRMDLMKELKRRRAKFE